MRSGAPWLAFPEWVQRAPAACGVVAVIAGLVFYVLAADTLGFHLTGIVLLALWMRILGASWRMRCRRGGGRARSSIHLAFYKVLRMPLPWGLFERWAF